MTGLLRNPIFDRSEAEGTSSLKEEVWKPTERSGDPIYDLQNQYEFRNLIYDSQNQFTNIFYESLIEFTILKPIAN